jgi:hypothetical protein
MPINRRSSFLAFGALILRIPKFENLFGKELKPVKTPMSEGYHPEVDDTPLCAEEDSAK